jgi:chorismate dehydratase
MPLRIAAVSYLNTKPFIYGLLQSDLAQEIDIQLCIPSECARRLKSGEVDLALAPVAIIPELDEVHLVSDYCIGAFGKVNTVSIFSELPIDQVQAIYMDFHSRTSVALAKVICGEHLHIKPEFWPATEGYEQRIGGSVAGLVIGDRAIGLDQKYPFVYDLSELWLEMTGLPFVFAAWIATKPLDAALSQRLNAAFADGLNRIPELLQVLPTVQHFDLRAYYEKHISYDFNADKRTALKRFLAYLEPEKRTVLHFSGALAEN